MPKKEPRVTVYRNRKTGGFSVHPHARHFGTPQEFGDPIILSADVTDDKMLEVIIETLSMTETQKYDLAQAPKYSVEERRRRLKEDQLIGVRKLAEGFELVPFRKMRSSFGSIEEMTKVIPTEQFLSEGGAIIRQIFRDLQ